MLGGYLGSYTGVLLASTAVPLWARSRLFLGPIFVCHRDRHRRGGRPGSRSSPPGCPRGHPTRVALGAVETVAMGAELAALAGQRAPPRRPRRRRCTRAGPGRLFRAAKWLVRAGFALRLRAGAAGRRAHDVASVMYLAAGLLFRFAWVEAGKASARDDEAVARMARARSAPA